jgi:hypothetical protein
MGREVKRSRVLVRVAADGDPPEAAGSGLIKGLLVLLGGNPVASLHGRAGALLPQGAVARACRLTQNTRNSALNRTGAPPVGERLPAMVTKGRTPCAAIVIPAPVGPAVPATIMSDPS